MNLSVWNLCSCRTETMASAPTYAQFGCQQVAGSAGSQVLIHNQLNERLSVTSVSNMLSLACRASQQIFARFQTGFGDV